MAENWEGVEAATAEHRTVGPHRAWCLDENEWCYPSDEGMCDCCAFVAGYVLVRVPRQFEDAVLTFVDELSTTKGG